MGQGTIKRGTLADSDKTLSNYIKRKNYQWHICNLFLICDSKEFCRHSEPHWYKAGYCYDPCEKGQKCIKLNHIEEHDE